MPKYKAILFSTDGDWTTDFYDSESISEVQERLADVGSKWFFYPIHGVIRDNGITTSNQRILDISEGFEYVKGKTIYTAKKWIHDLPPDYIEAWFA